MLQRCEKDCPIPGHLASDTHNSIIHPIRSTGVWGFHSSRKRSLLEVDDSVTQLTHLQYGQRVIQQRMKPFMVNESPQRGTAHYIDLEREMNAVLQTHSLYEIHAWELLSEGALQKKKTLQSKLKSNILAQRGHEHEFWETFQPSTIATANQR